MSFVYCDKCKWNQDDFWSEGYNPLKLLCDENWKSEVWDKLLEVANLDDIYMYSWQNGREWYKPDEYENFRDKITIEGCSDYQPITYREYAIMLLNDEIKKISNMQYPTRENWINLQKKGAFAGCPKCGNEHLIED